MEQISLSLLFKFKKEMEQISLPLLFKFKTFI